MNTFDPKLFSLSLRVLFWLTRKLFFHSRFSALYTWSDHQAPKSLPAPSQWIGWLQKAGGYHFRLIAQFRRQLRLIGCDDESVKAVPLGANSILIERIEVWPTKRRWYEIYCQISNGQEYKIKKRVKVEWQWWCAKKKKTDNFVPPISRTRALLPTFQKKYQTFFCDQVETVVHITRRFLSVACLSLSRPRTFQSWCLQLLLPGDATVPYILM